MLFGLSGRIIENFAKWDAIHRPVVHVALHLLVADNLEQLHLDQLADPAGHARVG